MKRAIGWFACIGMIFAMLVVAQHRGDAQRRYPTKGGGGAGGGAVSSLVTYSPADYGKRHNVGGQSGTGSQYETGCVFRFPVAATLVGVRYWAPTGSTGTHSIDVYNYDTGGAAIASLDKSVTGGNIVTATFLTPVPLAAGVGYNLAVFSVAYSQVLYNYSGGGNTRVSVLLGPSLYLELCGYHNTVNSRGVLDTPDSSGIYFGIEPVYTVP